MRYLALYETVEKVANSFENYDEEATLSDGRLAYQHNVRRYIAESKKRGTPWLYWDNTSAFNLSGYTQPYLTNSILLVGDSRTYMWQTTETDHFASFTTVDNRGVGGDTAHNQAIVMPTWGLNKYEKAVVSIGVNDGMYSVADTVWSIANLVSYIKTRSKKVFLTNIPTINMNWFSNPGATQEGFVTILTHSLSVNTAIPTICQNVGAEYIDLHGALGDPSTQMLKTQYDDGSGIHYNEAGYTLIRSIYASHGI